MNKPILVSIDSDTLEKYKTICYVQNIKRKHMFELLIKSYADNWDADKPDDLSEFLAPTDKIPAPME